MRESAGKVRARTVDVVAAVFEPAKFIRDHGRPPRMLDVGCGAADLLAAARERGFEVRGLEISSAAVALAKKSYGIDVDLTPIDEYSERYDVVTSMGVLEHVTDPIGLVRSMAKLVAPGGILLIYTPAWGTYDRVASVVARWFGTSRFIERRISRAHLQVFSPRALERALVEAGVIPESVRTLCEYNVPVHFYFRQLGIESPRLQTLASRVAAWMIDRGLFFRNNMQVIARRRT